MGITTISHLLHEIVQAGREVELIDVRTQIHLAVADEAELAE